MENVSHKGLPESISYAFTLNGGTKGLGLSYVFIIKY
jgi:hypothetical protein